jgi:DNA-binding response OmpR family regulator
MNTERIPWVLLVDDDPSHNQAMAKILEQAGYCVCAAGNGEEALVLFSGRPFDLVITDLQMPRQSGLELLRSIRAQDPQVAVVVLTAFGEWTTYVQAMDSGAVDYMNKPVRREDILLTIRKALARRGLRAPDVPSA